MNKRLSLLLALVVSSCPLLFSACGGGGGGGGGSAGLTASGALGADSGAVFATCDSSVDADGDGLNDCEELLLSTNPLLADTDGDGLSDGREVLELGFDPDVNPYKFNPLVADTPKLAIVLRSAPSVRLFLEDDQAVTKTVEVDRTYQTTVDVSQSTTEIVQEVVALSQESAQDTTISGGVPTDVTITDSINRDVFNSLEFDFTEEQSVENRQAVTEIEAFEKDRSITASGGVIKLTVEFANVGNVAFQVATEVLSAVIPDSSHSGGVLPIANLVPDTVDPFYDPYPPFTLPPGGRFPALNFQNNTLDLKSALEILNSESILIGLAGLELLDENGVAFAARFADIETRDALIVIDYAGLRPPERFEVATNLDSNSPGVTVGSAFTKALHIPFEAGPIDWNGVQKTGLLGLRNDPSVRAGPEKNASWLVVHTRGHGPSKKVEKFSFLLQDFDFENLELRGGDALYLVFLQDQDGDGVFSRQERLFGTSDIVVDSDGDGLTDFHEINVSHTNPSNPDTDGDGVIDSLDSNPLDPSIQ
jgi:hypothetical protein